jgi:LPXTG-motif cell wall-anchored protein
LDGQPNEDVELNTGDHTVAILFSIIGALVFVAAVFVFLWYRRRARAIEYASVAHSGIDGYAFSVDSDPEDDFARGENHVVELESGQDH